MNAIAVATIDNVAKTKSPPDEYAMHAQRMFDDIVKRDFTSSEGKRWAERRIAKSLHLSQPQIHVMLQGEGKGFGVNALIAIASYENVSVDAVLGRELSRATQQRQRQLDDVVTTVDELLAYLGEVGIAPTATSKLGKLIDRIVRAKGRAIGQKHLDAAVERANASRRKAG